MLNSEVFSGLHILRNYGKIVFTKDVNAKRREKTSGSERANACEKTKAKERAILAEKTTPGERAIAGEKTMIRERIFIKEVGR